MNKPKVAAIIQARMGSSRLPGKVLLDLNGKSVLQHIVERVSRAKLVDEVIIATTVTTPEDHFLINHCLDDLKIKTFIGSENDVLQRVLDAADEFDVDIIVDITADCPLVDPDMIDYHVRQVLDNTFNYNLDLIYASNIYPFRLLPDGLDVQVYTEYTLYAISEIVDDFNHRCHVGWNITNYKKYFHDLKIYSIEFQLNEKMCHPEWGLTLDTEEDYKLLKKIFTHFGDNKFNTSWLVEYLYNNSELLKINNNVKRKIPGEG
jgi:spore coat polysaccharide biosynthesis protein SpsF